MFHKLVVKHTIETNCPKAQVDQLCSQDGHHPQAEDLTSSLMLEPRGWVNIGSEDMAVCGVQHVIHGSVCEEDDAYAYS